MRKDILAKKVTTGKIEGHKDTGRPRLTFTTQLAKWTKTRSVELIRLADGRKEFERLTAKVRL